MPKWCSVGTCNNHHQMIDGSTKKQKFRFFQFPNHQKAPERREKWAQACGRSMPGGRDSWRPDPHVKAVYICSEHFISGKCWSTQIMVYSYVYMFIFLFSLWKSAVYWQAKRKIFTNHWNHLNFTGSDKIILQTSTNINRIFPKYLMNFFKSSLFYHLGEPVNQPKHPDYVPTLNLDTNDSSCATPVSQQRIWR